MKIELNSGNYPNISKTLLFIIRRDEILISSDDGVEIASLKVEIMNETTEIKDSKKWKDGPTENFWVSFRPVSSLTHQQFADCFVK